MEKTENITYEALGVKNKESYGTKWIKIDVFECINLQIEANGKWLSFKQDVHEEIYIETTKIAAEAFLKAKQ
jgi:hypothetical protein